MTAQKTQAQNRISRFIKIFKRLKNQVCAIFTPASMKMAVESEVRQVYQGAATCSIGAGESDRDKIDRIFVTSLKEGSLLKIFYRQDSQPDLARKIEQVIKEGHLTVRIRDNWTKVEPVEGWQCILWVNLDQVSPEQFPAISVITDVLVVDS